MVVKPNVIERSFSRIHLFDYFWAILRSLMSTNLTIALSRFCFEI